MLCSCRLRLVVLPVCLSYCKLLCSTVSYCQCYRFVSYSVNSHQLPSVTASSVTLCRQLHDDVIAPFHSSTRCQLPAVTRLVSYTASSVTLHRQLHRGVSYCLVSYAALCRQLHPVVIYTASSVAHGQLHIVSYTSSATLHRPSACRQFVSRCQSQHAVGRSVSPRT